MGTIRSRRSTLRFDFRWPLTQVDYRLVTKQVGLIILLALSSFAQNPASRDWRYWPFSQTSPWNTPVGSGAKYTKLNALNNLEVQINVTSWTSAVYLASSVDPKGSLRFSPASGSESNYAFLLASRGSTCGNNALAESKISAASSPRLGFEYNFYSTISTPNTQQWILPPNILPASLNMSIQPYVPSAACASPDSDGYLAIFQPDGLVLDTINSVTLSDQTIVSAMASYVDAKGDGAGLSNGRRASLLPSFAGLVRNGEIGAGRIPHALAAIAPRRLLLAKAVWPAAAFDRGANYSGTLPMGSLLAIPASIDLDALGFSPTGRVIATAAQTFGIYIVDSGGDGIGILAELGNVELSEAVTSRTGLWNDLDTIASVLEVVSNNSATSPGGGGVPRTPLAPPFFSDSH